MGYNFISCQESLMCFRVSMLYNLYDIDDNITITVRISVLKFTSISVIVALHIMA